MESVYRSRSWVKEKVRRDWAAQQLSAQVKKEPQTSVMPAVRVINVTGQIVKRSQGYFIRGKKPAEELRVLNPDSTVLDKLVKSGRVVKISVRSVVGDNVDIETIGGKTYKEEKAARK